jgi:hypothetical protein
MGSAHVFFYYPLSEFRKVADGALSPKDYADAVVRDVDEQIARAHEGESSAEANARSPESA